MAKAIRFYEIGGPEVLRLETVEVGEPGPGQARVRHTGIAVNFIDIYFRTGRYPTQLPSHLGSDAVGVVEAIGPDVTDIAVGDRVGAAGRRVDAVDLCRPGIDTRHGVSENGRLFRGLWPE